MPDAPSAHPSDSDSPAPLAAPPSPGPPAADVAQVSAGGAQHRKPRLRLPAHKLRDRIHGGAPAPLRLRHKCGLPQIALARQQCSPFACASASSAPAAATAPAASSAAAEESRRGRQLSDRPATFASLLACEGPRADDSVRADRRAAAEPPLDPRAIRSPVEHSSRHHRPRLLGPRGSSAAEPVLPPFKPPRLKPAASCAPVGLSASQSEPVLARTLLGGAREQFACGDTSRSTTDAARLPPREVASPVADGGVCCGTGGQPKEKHALARCTPDFAAPDMAVPLVRGRERLQLLKRVAIFADFADAKLVQLASLAKERSFHRYQAVRPNHTLYVLVYGAVAPPAAEAAPRLPPLVDAAADAPSASAAKTVASDAAIAGSASEPGSTVGLECVVGPLHATAVRMQAISPTLLLSFCVADLAAFLPPRTLEALCSEARLRMLLRLPFFSQAAAPIPLLRALAMSTSLLRTLPGHHLFTARDSVTKVYVLVSGRVDVVAEDDRPSPRSLAHHTTTPHRAT
ncbi:hypothetical protein AB1Y20_004761 [Prymnesium parvum]|uniref:Cyclic nucleotide-binding domain-containing protein n=1 Tax=Prymnesium parvum TaxID=97485 RepID=A0AB34IXR0_PRYPA